MKISYFQSVRSQQAQTLTLKQFLALTRCHEVEEAAARVAQGDKDAKRLLPVVTWQSYFQPGTRRSNAAARPSGLFMLDFDHISQMGIEGCASPFQLYERLLPLMPPDTLAVAHMTPSQDGLRLVFRIDPRIPRPVDIAELQRGMCARLKMEGRYDTACKDMARCSFLPPYSYFYFLDQRIFEESWESEDNNNPTTKTEETKTEDNGHSDNSAAHPAAGGDCGMGPADSPAAEHVEERLTDGAAEPAFRGIPYSKIVAELVAAMGGEPAEGERNTTLYRLLRKLRYICDFKAELLFKVAPRFGLSEDEVRSVCESAVKGGRGEKIPYDLWQLCAQLGAELESDEADDGDEADDDSTAPAADGMPPLPPLFKQFARAAPTGFAPAVVFALLPVLGTLASRLRARYLDGNLHAPNFITVIEAPQASGKSFTRRIVETCMRPIAQQDEIARQQERAYQQTLRVMKNAKQLPEEPQVIIRQIPATVSVAKLLKRLEYARGLHLFSYLEEIDTLTKSNKSGAWAQKSDIYRNAYDNAEYGQDYMSENSWSANVHVYYNMLCMGTPRAVGRFFNDVEDGLVSRVLFCQLPDMFGAQMPVWRPLDAFSQKMVNNRTAQLNEQLALTQELAVRPEVVLELDYLNEALRQWQEQKRVEALKSQDQALDIYRRRCAVNGFRAGMLAHWLYSASSAKARANVTAFALWVAERSLEGLLNRFGDELNKIVLSAPAPRKSSFAMLFDTLPDEFDKYDVAAAAKKHIIVSPVKMIIYRWVQNGLIIKTGKGKWTKKK